jgi:hypothetical protein
VIAARIKNWLTSSMLPMPTTSSTYGGWSIDHQFNLRRLVHRQTPVFG